MLSVVRTVVFISCEVDGLDLSLLGRHDVRLLPRHAEVDRAAQHEADEEFAQEANSFHLQPSFSTAM
jgi:hypothetical protein